MLQALPQVFAGERTAAGTAHTAQGLLRERQLGAKHRRPARLRMFPDLP